MLRSASFNQGTTLIFASAGGAQLKTAKQANGALQQVFGKVSPLQSEVAEHQVEIRSRQPGTAASTIAIISASGIKKLNDPSSAQGTG